MATLTPLSWRGALIHTLEMMSFVGMEMKWARCDDLFPTFLTCTDETLTKDDVYKYPV